MKSFIVKRSFDEEVVVIKAIYKDVDVNIEDITDQDINSMKFPQLRSYARAIRLLFNDNLASQRPMLTQPEPPQAVSSDDAVVVENFGRIIY